MTDRIADLLGHVLDEATGPDDWRPSSDVLDRVWAQLVAPEAAEFTCVDRVEWDEGRLVVAVDSEARLGEIERHHGRFESRLAARIPGDLETLAFEVGDVDRSDRAPTTERTDSDDDPPSASPADADSISPEHRELLERFDAESRSAALRILSHVRDTDE